MIHVQSRAENRTRGRFLARIAPARDRPLPPARATFSTQCRFYQSARYCTMPQIQDWNPQNLYADNMLSKVGNKFSITFAWNIFCILSKPALSSPCLPPPSFPIPLRCRHPIHRSAKCDTRSPRWFLAILIAPCYCSLRIWGQVGNEAIVQWYEDIPCWAWQKTPHCCKHSLRN